MPEDENVTRLIDVRSLRIFAQTTPCAHSCRYCLVGPKKTSNVAFSRFADIVERFVDWQNGSTDHQFSILAGFEDSYEFSVETLKGLFELYGRIGWGDECKGIKLGGLKWRPKAKMRRWLEARRDHADLRIVHASLAGCGSVHDSWNRRNDDFDFLFQTMTTAAELGLLVHQRIFVVKSTLPVLCELLDKLDEIPGKALRYLSTFVYRGLATRLEEERITEVMRDHLPTRIAAISQRAGDRWLSEREWIEDFADEVEDECPQKIEIELEINEENIDRLENMHCEEIVADLINRTQNAYAMLPSRLELRTNCADSSNRRIYASLEELERKWLDHYRNESTFQIERILTHLK